MRTSETIDITIEESLSEHDLASCDFSLEISSELVSPYDDLLNKRPIPKRQKDYDFDPVAWLDTAPERHALYVARSSNRVVGFASIAETWNGMAEVEEIAVDQKFRRQGIAAALLSKVEEWTRQQDFSWMRLETQAGNPDACRAYARAGFVLEGFDRRLYAGGPDDGEVALFWYKKLLRHG